MSDQVWNSDVAPHVSTGRLRYQGWEDDKPVRYIREDKARSAFDSLTTRLAQAEQELRRTQQELRGAEQRVKELEDALRGLAIAAYKMNDYLLLQSEHMRPSHRDQFSEALLKAGRALASAHQGGEKGEGM